MVFALQRDDVSKYEITKLFQSVKGQHTLISIYNVLTSIYSHLYMHIFVSLLPPTGYYKLLVGKLDLHNCLSRLQHLSHSFPEQPKGIENGKCEGIVCGRRLYVYVKGPTRASVAPLEYMLHLIGTISSVKYDFSFRSPFFEHGVPWFLVNTKLGFNFLGKKM